VLSLRFDPEADLILTHADIKGPNKSEQVRLVLDTGASRTEIDSEILTALGYSESDKVRDLGIESVAGPTHETFSVKLDTFAALGATCRNYEVAFVDFSKWKKDQIDGLLGWDFIRMLHYEQNGPKGLLTIF
jgi:predicted aspartyl protease